MSDKTRIEWTDATWNPVTGCTKVSSGCKHCYAERDWARLSANPKTRYYGRDFTDVKCHADVLDLPLRWRRPRRIFVNSMSDLFHPAVPIQFLEDVMTTMELARHHTFQVLTKRPTEMLDALQRIATPVPSNVWLGVSVEDQATADERIPLLLQTPTAVRWISAEPLLGPISLRVPFDGVRVDAALGASPGIPRLDWVVCGGESGPKARPMHPSWPRSLRDQCQAAGVPFLFKQWGEWQTINDMSLEAIYRTPGTAPGDRFSDGTELYRCDKKSAGRLLDGVEHNGYPS